MSKKLIIVALAVAISAGLAQAADVTNITGVTGVNGVYNISPEHQFGTAAYRKYNNFDLAKDDIANLQFDSMQGHSKPVNAFINLVGSNGVNINGIVNSTRNGSYFGGHAIFITPGKFTLGSNGVLNVGQLSVGTPTQSVYNNMVNGYGDHDFDYYTNIGSKVSKLAQNSNGTAGAADIDLQGYIFTQSGVQMTGKDVALGTGIVNGLKNPGLISTSDQAGDLFALLVNTDGTATINPAHSDYFNFLNPTRVLIKSENGMVANAATITNPGDVYLTNHGTNGMTVTGRYASDSGLVRMYNTKGDLKLTTTSARNSHIDGKSIVLKNSGANLSVNEFNELNGTDIQIGNLGTGALTFSGQATASNSLAVKNTNGSGLTMDGSLTTTAGALALNNQKGAMLVDGNVTAAGGNVGIINEGTGLTITKNSTVTHTGRGNMDIYNKGNNGLTIVGDVNNNGNLRVMTDAGKLSLATDSSGEYAADITNTNGDVKIVSRGTSTGLFQTSRSTVQNTAGNISIRNKGTGVASGTRGLDLQGTVKTVTSGVTAINNQSGNMYVGGNVTSAGNMGIINRAGGGEMEVASAANIKGGNINVKNFGTDDMTVNGTIEHTGRVNVLANTNKLNLGGAVHNNSGSLGANGGFYAAARANGKGVNVTSGFNGDGTGEYLIRNITGSEGLTYAGKINTTGNRQVAVVNRKGDMTFSDRSEVTSTGGQVVISSKGDNGKLTITNGATISSGSGTRGILYVEPASTGHAGQLDPSIGTSATIHRMDGHGKLLGRNWD